MSVQAPPRKIMDRPPPRRRVRRRSVWRSIIWPVLKYSAVAALVFLLGQMVAGKVARPFRLLRSELRETDRITTELKSLRKQNEALERRLKYLQTPRGAAQAARKLGYVKPGEVLLVLPPKATPPAKKRGGH
jgi:cell division protein FtsB